MNYIMMASNDLNSYFVTLADGSSLEKMNWREFLRFMSENHKIEIPVEVVLGDLNNYLPEGITVKIKTLAEEIDEKYDNLLIYSEKRAKFLDELLNVKSLNSKTKEELKKLYNDDLKNTEELLAKCKSEGIDDSARTLKDYLETLIICELVDREITHLSGEYGLSIDRDLETLLAELIYKYLEG